MLKAFINVRIYDYENYIENGYVIFDKQIIKVGSMNDYKNLGYIEKDLHGELLLPNLVCAHTHIYSIFARGLSLPFNPNNFKEILEQMWWKIDSKIDKKITYYSGIAAGSEFIKNGVTTIIDHHASGKDIVNTLSQLKKSLNDVCGIRTLLCFETSDRFDVSQCIKENESMLGLRKNGYCYGLFGMHASMTLSNETLKKVHDSLSFYPIHIHVGESEMDEIDSKNNYQKNIISRLDEYNLLNDDSLLVHGVHLSLDELKILSKKNVYIVINPSSNMNNAVGLSNALEFKNYGIKTMLGNDGLSCSMANEYQNLLYTNHLVNKNVTKFNLNDLLMFINNAYEYVSKKLNVNIGRIQEGYEADFSILEYFPFTEMNSSNAFGHIFYGLYPNYHPMSVYVEGECLLRNSKLLSSKLNRELNKCKNISKDFWESFKE